MRSPKILYEASNLNPEFTARIEDSHNKAFQEPLIFSLRSRVWSFQAPILTILKLYISSYSFISTTVGFGERDCGFIGYGGVPYINISRVIKVYIGFGGSNRPQQTLNPKSLNPKPETLNPKSLNPKSLTNIPQQL